MARYTGPKNRLSRREGVDLFGKGNRLTRLNIPPGMHGPKGSFRKVSQFGKQLREKQKTKRIYGVLERQFRKYVDKALRAKGNTGETLLRELELRLDNIVFRLGFAKTRFQARQLVSHKHILLNGVKVNIPSYRVRVGDTISLSGKAFSIPNVKTLVEDEELVIPQWLKRKKGAGLVERLPERSDIMEPISEQEIVEYYSR